MDDMFFDLGILLIVADGQRIDQKRLHVKSSRELNFCFIFLFPQNTFLLEALKMQNEDLGSSVDAHLLVG